MYSFVKVHGVSCDRRVRFASADTERSMPATDLHFLANESGKFVTCLSGRTERPHAGVARRRVPPPSAGAAPRRPPSTRHVADTDTDTDTSHIVPTFTFTQSLSIGANHSSRTFITFSCTMYFFY